MFFSKGCNITEYITYVDPLILPLYTHYDNTHYEKSDKVWRFNQAVVTRGKVDSFKTGCPSFASS